MLIITNLRNLNAETDVTVLINGSVEYVSFPYECASISAMFQQDPPPVSIHKWNDVENMLKNNDMRKAASLNEVMPVVIDNLKKKYNFSKFASMGEPSDRNNPYPSYSRSFIEVYKSGKWCLWLKQNGAFTAVFDESIPATEPTPFNPNTNIFPGMRL